MDRRALGAAAPVRTFATLAVLTAAGAYQIDENGKTWHHTRAGGHGGSYAAVFTAPPGALVTLRTRATDAAGGTVTETITSAYRTGR